jgi:hypothetical protein
MALVLNTNSYVNTTEADLYFDTRIDSANWSNAESSVKEQALVTATQIIDENAWIGYAVSSSQALAWPRKNASYSDPKLGMVVSVAEDEVPDRVKVAVYEQALHLVENEDLLGGQTQTFESITVGQISLTDSNNDVRKVPMKTPNATRYIRPLLVRGGAHTWWRAN